MPQDRPLRFGVFYAPFHPVGQDPTLALEYDLERVAELDRLGYDEAWFGEHHSGGYELIGSPEIFIAAAAERTKHIKLGTGGVSLLSLSMSAFEGFAAVGKAWEVVDEAAKKVDKPAPDRSTWRVLGTMHI